MNLREKIEYLEDIRGRIEDMSSGFEERIAELQEEIDAERETIRLITENLRNEEDELRKEIQDEVMALQTTMKGERVKFIYKKGSTRWDSKALAKAAEEDESLLQYKTTGQPSIQMRWD